MGYATNIGLDRAGKKISKSGILINSTSLTRVKWILANNGYVLYFMMQIIAIALGGASGALLRFWASGWAYAQLGRGFPYGTLLVNVVGSLAMGLLYVWLIERSALSAEWRAGLLVGLLGAFTTFSSFSIETLALVEGGELSKALLNVFLSVVLCLAAAWGGMIIGRQL